MHRVLTNPKYIGENIYNRRSLKQKHRRVKNPVQMWIWRDGEFEPIVPASLFEQARTIIESRHLHLSDQGLLERLRELLRIQGRIGDLPALCGEIHAWERRINRDRNTIECKFTRKQARRKMLYSITRTRD